MFVKITPAAFDRVVSRHAADAAATRCFHGSAFACAAASPSPPIFATPRQLSAVAIAAAAVDAAAHAAAAFRRFTPPYSPIFSDSAIFERFFSFEFSYGAEGAYARYAALCAMQRRSGGAMRAAMRGRVRALCAVRAGCGGAAE
jgi:hypothetical protein